MLLICYLVMPGPLRTLSLLALFLGAVSFNSPAGAQTKAPAPGTDGAVLVITLPDSDNIEATALKALHDISTQYAAYTAASPHAKITLREISITVLNHQHRFMGSLAFPPGVVGTRELTGEQVASETQQVTAAVSEYLYRKTLIVTSATYGLLVELYDDDRIFYDNNRNPRGAVTARLFLIDSAGKRLLWFSDKPGGLSGVFDGAVKEACNQIRYKLKTVLGDQ